MNATISEDDKNQIKRYLLGQLAEADEELLELRLMSDAAFIEEFDIVVDEIATLYVSRYFKGDEKMQVEQYFLRSPQRRDKVQFICELVRQLGEDVNHHQPGVVPVQVDDPRPTLWQRVSAFWAQPSAFRPAMMLATLLIVGGLVFWVISLNSNSTYQSFELAMTTSSERNAGTQKTRIQLDSGVDGLRIKLKLPTPTAQSYRATLQGDKVPLQQLAIETQDAESITVTVPADQITLGTYAIQLIEINNGRETPLRGSYEFVLY